jgi:hypothetical protein
MGCLRPETAVAHLVREARDISVRADFVIDYSVLDCVARVLDDH